MTQQGLSGRVKRLVLGGALAALLAAGAAGAGVQSDPSQWGVTAGDPSQWGRASRPTTTDDPQTALNFTKIEYKTSALNYTKIEYKNAASVGVERAGSRVGTSSTTREST